MYIVTGANGFIGSALVRDLNARNITEIICVDIVDLKERPEPLRKAQYSQFFTTEQFFSWCSENQQSRKIKTVFHMGAISSTTETDWEKLKKNNIELSQFLFEACKQWNCHYIYASSGAVYGGGEHGFSDTTDTAEFKPLNLYGKSKQDFDLWALKQIATPPAWHGLRFFNVYGPNEYHKNDMASVVYKAFLQIKASGTLKLFRSHNPEYKDGEQVRDFVYVKDITRWMIEIAEKNHLPPGIYNQGYGEARPWLDLARTAFEMIDVPMNIDWIDIPGHIRDQYQYFTEARMEKASQSGLTRPQYPIESGVRDYLKNYLLTDDPYL